MLKLILGRQMSGKSEYCMKRAEEAAVLGDSVVLLVPEQYTFETQKKILSKFGAKIFNKINILSFTGLCEEILSIYGGISNTNVDDGIRFILIKRALVMVGEQLKHYKKYVNSSEFAKKLLSVIGELKLANVSYEKLLKLSIDAKPSQFSDKLNDIALILKCYDSILNEKFTEPFDLINNTINKLPDNRYFEGKTFIIDEFKGFTESQYLLLDSIISSSKNTYISLTCDELNPKGETEVFYNVKKNAQRLKNLAKSRGVEFESVTLDSFGYKYKDIARFEEFLSENNVEIFDRDSSHINVVKAESISAEVDFVMCEIRRLVREENYRFRDFVIIARNAECYVDEINIAARRYNVNCYVDNKISAMELPLSIFAVSAVKAAESFETTDILTMLKTGMTNISDSEIFELENYCYVWSINRSNWTENWNNDPKGFNIKGDNAENSNIQLNKTRKMVVNALFNLKNSFGFNMETVCKGLLNLFNEFSTVNALKDYAEKLNREQNFIEAEYQSAGYNVFIKTLDKLVLSSDDSPVSAKDFCDMLSSALRIETVGEIPQTKDQVIFGTADRIRASSPKISFVIGVNEGYFPKIVAEDNFFSNVEREVMRNSEILISDNSVEASIDEKYLFYNACTLSSDRVYITYPTCNVDGKELLPSTVVDQIVRCFKGCNQIVATLINTDINSVETAECALKLLSVGDGTYSKELLSVLSIDENYLDRISSFVNFSDSPLKVVSENTVNTLYKNDIVLSATKIETFSTCKFMHFCRYGLNLEPQRKVDFDALTKGNIIHYVLEHFINNHKDDIGSLIEDDIILETAMLCDRYIDVELGVDRSSLGEKFCYMLELLKKTANYVVCALNNEFAQSKYRPIACELSIGGAEKGIESVSVPTDKGRNVKIIGSVDRVDATADGKVRVVDYKSGKKTFELCDLLNGVKMQMLIYLYSIIKNGRDKLSVNHPTAVLYFPARKDIQNSNGKYVKMNGMITSNVDDILEMEESGLGEIVPVKFRQNGTSFYENKSTVDDDVFAVAFKYVELSLMRIGSIIEKGNISAQPMTDSMHSACDWCDYKLICRAADNDYKCEKKELNKASAIEALKKETEGY